MTPESLGLAPHPEGGWYRETWRAAGPVETAYGRRDAATAILFLLEPGQSSRWHRVRSDELWLWQGGGRLELLLGGTAEAASLRETVLVGPGPEDLQRLVPAGEWQAARPAGDEPVLVCCVVAPGFDFADFELEP